MMLVGIDWLQKHYADPDLVIIDTRPKISYEYGHIKNSYNISVDQIIQIDQYGSHLVCDQSLAASVFSAAGIDETKTVLVCGDYMDPSVSRMAWTLLYFSHQKTLIFESGLEDAQKSGIAFVRDISEFRTAEFKPQINNDIRIRSDELNANLKNYTIIDARSAQEFMGGHLPSAILIPFTDGIGLDGSHFQNTASLRSMFTQKGVKKDAEIICYCMHGHRASSLFFQLKLAGYDSVKLYDGSFVNWYGQRLPLE